MMSYIRIFKLLMILVSVFLLAGCASKTGEEVEIKKIPETTPIPSPTIVPTSSPDTVPKPHETVKGSLSNPGSVGEPIYCTYRDKTYEFTVLEVIRGSISKKLIESASKYNPTPSKGNEFLMVKVRIKYISGSDSEYISDWDIRAYIEGVEVKRVYLDEYPKGYNEFGYGYLLPNALRDGWLVLQVPIGKKVLIAYQELLGPSCYIEIPEIPSSTPKELKVTVGESVDFDGLKVTVIIAGSRFDYIENWFLGKVYPEKEGYNFLSIGVIVENTGKSSVEVSEDNFWIVDSEGRIYNPSSATYLLKDELESKTLYKGEKLEGKILFEIPKTVQTRDLIIVSDLWSPLFAYWMQPDKLYS